MTKGRLEASLFYLEVTMNIREAIDKADGFKPNQYLLEDKLTWLSQLDANIHEDILKTHLPVPSKDFTPYQVERMDVELIAPFPYDEMYVAYLEMKIDEKNEDTASYNNSMAIFQSHYDNYARFINKNHRPAKVSRLRY